jgi:hypothetical protein
MAITVDADGTVWGRRRRHRRHPRHHHPSSWAAILGTAVPIGSRMTAVAALS